MIAVGPGAPDKEGKVVPTAVKPGDRVLLPGWGGNPIKVGEDVSAFSFFRVALLDVVGSELTWLRGVGVPPVPRLGDPCEDPGVIEWLGLGLACEEVVVSCRVVSSGGGRR